jgi:hypothetical protein
MASVNVFKITAPPRRWTLIPVPQYPQKNRSMSS